MRRSGFIYSQTESIRQVMWVINNKLTNWGCDFAYLYCARSFFCDAKARLANWPARDATQTVRTKSGGPMYLKMPNSVFRQITKLDYRHTAVCSCDTKINSDEWHCSPFPKVAQNNQQKPWNTHVESGKGHGDKYARNNSGILGHVQQLNWSDRRRRKRATSFFTSVEPHLKSDRNG